MSSIDTAHPSRARRRTRLARSGALILAAGGLIVASTATAVADVTSYFELDGNVANDSATPPDWANLFTAGGQTAPDYTPAPTTASSLPQDFVSSSFFRDFTPGSTADSSTFATGSKDTLDITPGWQCKKSNNVTDKGDIQNTYMAPYRASNGHLIVFAGLEKNAPNGNNNMAVWLLKDGTVGCASGTGNTAFTGHHQDGDTLLVAAFLNGGSNPVINAYEWNNGALDTTALASGGKCGTAGSENLCAITNDTSQVTTPWITSDKVLGTGNSLGADQFYEMGADLTAILGEDTCFANYLANTRSSQELGATLYDFAGGSAPTCGALKVHKYIDNDGENGSLTSRTVTDGVTTSGSTTLQSASAAFKAADVGDVLTGDGIPAGTKINSVTDATHAVMSAAATKTATGVSVTIAEANGAGWHFTVNGPATDATYPAAGTAGPLICTGTTGTDGFLTCGSSDPGLTNLSPGVYTITETQSNGYYNTDPGSGNSTDIVKTGTVTKYVTLTTSGATIQFGNNCFVAKTWTVSNVPSGQPQLFVDYIVTSGHDAGRTVTDAATTSASTTLTSATAAFVNSDVGSALVGAGIPSGTNVASVTNATTVVMTKAATATATGVTVAIAPHHYVDLTTTGTTATNTTAVNFTHNDVISWSWGEYSGSTRDTTHEIAGATNESFAAAGCSATNPVNFPNATVNGFKYKDVDNNGSYDASVDAPLGGFQFRLMGGSSYGTQVGTTQTSASDGTFSFANVAPGSYKIIEIGQSRTVTDAVTTSGSTTLTSATAAFTGADVGSAISGAGIPAGTTISSVTNATTVVMSHAATATATGVTVKISTGWKTNEGAGGQLVTVNLGDTSETAVNFGNTPLSNITVDFNSLAKIPSNNAGAGGDATKATKIECKSDKPSAGTVVGTSTNSNSVSTGDLTLDQSKVTCVITFTDP